MPPVRTKKGDGPGTVRKEVEFVAKDADEQVATGIVMVPDKVDLQNDFVREDQIREFAEQFANFEEVGEAGGGIMHAVFPDDWLDLERNEVLEESETIGGEQAPAGAWVQTWAYNHDSLWELVEDGTFAGYSIGLDAVRWDGPFEQDDAEDVEVPEGIDEDELIWEIVDGIMREVSTVDIPAVPDAMILDKADEKALREHLGNRDAFIEEAMDRGHGEDAAEQMWDVLNEAAEIEGSGEPGKQSVFAKAGRAFLSTLSGSDDGDGSEAPEAGASKEGRTLSRSNEKRQMAVIDAALDTLQGAGVDHGMTRFTDEEDVNFDLSEHSAREWADPEEDEDEEEEEEDSKDAPEGDTSENTTDMSNDDNPDEEGGPDAVELAEQNAEQINDLTQAVEDLTEGLTGPEPKTAEIEIDGETHEVREEAAKAALGVDEESDIGVADAIEALNEKASRVDEVESRLDTIVQQSGAGSQQVDSAAEGGDDENDGGLEGLGKALS